MGSAVAPVTLSANLLNTLQLRLVGGVQNLNTYTITSISAASPALVTTSAAHGLATGDVVTITGSNSTPSIDGTWQVFVGSTTTFQLYYTIVSNSVANPTVVTIDLPGAAAAHALDATNTVTITGSNSTPTLDGSRTISSPTATTFTVPVNVTVAGSAGLALINCTGAGTAGTVTPSGSFRSSFGYQVMSP